MQRGPTGELSVQILGGERVPAFVPGPLPPEPPIVFDAGMQRHLERASLAVGRLDSVSTLLPDTHLFLYSYVRKEALLSSQIEGTQSSLSELLLFEIDDAAGAPLDDVVEVTNYVAALEHGLALLRGGLPLCNRVLREVHGRLLARGRGSDKAPGQFRSTQNWIGGSRPGNAQFVPPPPERVEECMQRLEQFLHEVDGPPLLVRAALAHAQFETIHPFLDGNGRVGRLMISLMLHAAGQLEEPMLYLSLFLKQNRREYYRLLDAVRESGDWEAWISFFLTGVAECADGAVETARRLMALFERDRLAIQQVGRRANSALRVHDAMKARPLQRLTNIAERTKLSFVAASRGMDVLIDKGIARELTGQRRNRVFAYGDYLAILNEGTENL
ncbi:MAG: Fic family protein [Planctomycetes bacterium]|nr:Fic family protein [Planctomycetota bacterium]